MGMKKWLYAGLVCSLFAVSLAHAQEDALKGTWTLQTKVPGSEFSVLTFDAEGNVSFTESIVHSIGDTEYNFNTVHRGKAEFTETRQLLYIGAGAGVAAESKQMAVASEIVATGMGTEDNNLLIGIWKESQAYTQLISPVDTYSATPVAFIMTREGSTPALGGKLLEGEWQLDINDDSLIINWEGVIELGAEGTILGMLREEGRLADIPVAGLFTIVDPSEFEFSYSTTAEIKNVGVFTFTVSGSGQINEDRTEITGTFTISIERQDENEEEEPAGMRPQALVDREPLSYTGPFTLTKLQSSSAPSWELLQ